MDILANTYPDRNLTEPRRIAYRMGWILARYNRNQTASFAGVWLAILFDHPAADEDECAEQFRMAWFRRECVHPYVTED